MNTLKHLLHYQVHNKCYINLPLKKKVKSVLSLLPPCLLSVLSSSFVSGSWQHLLAGLLASSLASLQSNLHTSVKGSELYKVHIAYSFTLLKNILWLSKQMNLMNSLPASPASFPVFHSLMTHITKPHIYIHFLEHIILFYFLSNGRFYKQVIFKKNRLGTLHVEHIILFYNIVSCLCYSSSWHP